MRFPASMGLVTCTKVSCEMLASQTWWMRETHGVQLGSRIGWDLRLNSESYGEDEHDDDDADDDDDDDDDDGNIRNMSNMSNMSNMNNMELRAPG